MFRNVFKALIFVVFLLTGGLLHAQGNPDPYKNRVILKYYNKQELAFLESNKPEKFTYIKNYFIHSFFITPVPCSGCNSIDPALLDVKEFEMYRLEDASNTVTDTLRGFKITLISKRQLELMGKSMSPVNATGIRSDNKYSSPAVLYPNRNCFFNKNYFKSADFFYND